MEGIMLDEVLAQGSATDISEVVYSAGTVLANISSYTLVRLLLMS